jgi:hypothetical protein
MDGEVNHKSTKAQNIFRVSVLSWFMQLAGPSHSRRSDLSLVRCRRWQGRWALGRESAKPRRTASFRVIAPSRLTTTCVGCCVGETTAVIHEGPRRTTKNCFQTIDEHKREWLRTALPGRLRNLCSLKCACGSRLPFLSVLRALRG